MGSRQAGLKQLAAETASSEIGTESKVASRCSSQILIIIIKILFSNVYNVKFMSSRLVSIEILYQLSHHLDESQNLHITLPYLIQLFDDPYPTVVCSSYHHFCQILAELNRPFQQYEDILLFF